MSVGIPIYPVELPKSKKDKLHARFADDVIASDEHKQQHPTKKKKKKIIKVPSSTKHVKVTVTHEHRHSFVTNEFEDAEDAKAREDSKKIITEARRLEQQHESQLSRIGISVPSSPAYEAKPEPEPTTNSEKIDELQKLSDTLSAFQNPNQILSSIFGEQKQSNNNNDDDDDNNNNEEEELEYGSEPLFDAFVFDDTYERLNWHQNIVDDPKVQIKSVDQKRRTPLTLPMKTLILNNMVLKSHCIENRKLLVSISDITRRSFDDISFLQSPSDIEDAKNFVRFEPSRIDPTDREYTARIQNSIEEQSSSWARAYQALDRSGNTARVERSTMSVSEKAEVFVRSSSFRKAMFEPRTNERGTVFSGQHGLLTMLETPNLFLLPTTAAWSKEMQVLFGKPTGGDYGEFVDFERCRFNVLNSDPLLADAGWMLWQSTSDRAAHCPVLQNDLHYELQERGWLITANAKFFCHPAEDRQASSQCECAKNATIVLCGKKNHVHSVHQKSAPQSAHRTGADNSCLVAADVFGAASRERWISLMVICGHLKSGRHGHLLTETFLKALDGDKHLCALTPCIREFAVDNPTLLRTGKPHDERKVQRIGGRERQINYLSYSSHGRERFCINDPLAMTLALLLFIECQMTAGWYNVWRVWVSLLQTHARCCPFCSSEISESLYRLVVYNVMLPVLPITMSTLLEQLAATLRCNKQLYR